MTNIIVHSDGGARGNPGPAAVGIVIETAAGEPLQEIAETIGEATNNIAEYTAVLRGLYALQAMYGEETTRLRIDWRLDSELVVRQLAGEYQVKHPGLRSLFEEIRDLRPRFPHLSFRHVPREKNREADRLVNEALDRR